MFPSRTITNPPNTQTQRTHITDRLDLLANQLTLKPFTATTQAIERGITFEMDIDSRPVSNDILVANAFDFLTQERETPSYKHIGKKIKTGEMLSSEEILYFSLVTDNINLIPLEILNFLKEKKAPHSELFCTHINLLYYSIQLGIETDQHRRTSLSDNIKSILQTRATVGTHLTFCNLAGINFKGIEFSFTAFEWLNLNNANFSSALFHDSTFESCSLEQAQFQESKNLALTNTKSFSLSKCRLNKANFSETALTIQAEGCNFTQANFTKAMLNARFKGCALNGCFFDQATLTRETRFEELCSLDACDFSNATLQTTINPDVTYTGLILFSVTQLTNPVLLNKKLDMLHPKSTFNAEQLSHYRIMLANVLLNQLKQEVREEAQKTAIATARAHPLFASQNLAKRFCNFATTGFGIFSSTQVSKTTAELMLETALLSPITTTPPPQPS